MSFEEKIDALVTELDARVQKFGAPAPVTQVVDELLDACGLTPWEDE